MSERFARIAIATALVAASTVIASCGGGSDDDGPGIVDPNANKRTLAITGGSGNGRVTSSPGTIDCVITNGVATGTCADQFSDKTNVALTAIPGTDQLFKAWSGDCSGTTCTVALTRNSSVSAGFVGKVVTFALSYQSPASDDGAALIAITGPAITAISPGAGLQIVQKTRTSDSKTILLVRGNLTTGGLGNVSVSGLDADKTFSAVVEQVAARQNADPKLSYAQRANLSSYTVTLTR